MKKQILFSMVVALLIISCKKETPKETPDKIVPITEKPLPAAPTKECYSYKGNGSDINMEINYNGTAVSGTLNYFLAEKDSNAGTFTGKYENGIMLLDYTFQSEGTQSTRQVAFQLKDGKLIEGYGELTEDGARFKDVSTLKFDSKMPLTKGGCPKDF